MARAREGQVLDFYEKQQGLTISPEEDTQLEKISKPEKEAASGEPSGET